MVIADKDCKTKVQQSKSQLHYKKQPLQGSQRDDNKCLYLTLQHD
jgi:hypothetical protein